VLVTGIDNILLATDVSAFPEQSYRVFSTTQLLMQNQLIPRLLYAKVLF